MTETMQSQHYAASMVSSLCADALIAAAVEAAARYGTAAVSVAVVDGSGLLKAFRRADEAAVLTIDIAMDKAWTAASSGLPTHTWNGLFREHEQLTQAAPRGDCRWLPFAPGEPSHWRNRDLRRSSSAGSADRRGSH